MPSRVASRSTTPPHDARDTAFDRARASPSPPDRTRNSCTRCRDTTWPRSSSIRPSSIAPSSHSARASTCSSRLRCLRPARRRIAASRVGTSRVGRPAPRRVRGAAGQSKRRRCAWALQSGVGDSRAQPLPRVRMSFTTASRRRPIECARISVAQPSVDPRTGSEPRAAAFESLEMPVEKARPAMRTSDRLEESVAVLQAAIARASIVACAAIDQACRAGRSRRFPARAGGPRLGARLLEFALGIGVRHDAGAGAQLDFVVVHGHRADQDIEVEPPIVCRGSPGRRYTRRGPRPRGRRSAACSAPWGNR